MLLVQKPLETGSSTMGKAVAKAKASFGSTSGVESSKTRSSSHSRRGNRGFRGFPLRRLVRPRKLDAGNFMVELLQSASMSHRSLNPPLELTYERAFHSQIRSTEPSFLPSGEAKNATTSR